MRREDLGIYIFRNLERVSKGASLLDVAILSQEMYEEIEKLIDDEIEKSETLEIIKRMELK